MALAFKRASLITQVTDALRAELLKGQWKDWLPSERELSTTLHVSRNSCRSALNMLRKEGLIRSVHGRGTRIAEHGGAATLLKNHRARSVGVIAPQPLGLLRPRQALFLDEVRDELFDMGVRIQMHNSPACYSRYPGRALEKLVETNSHDCWIVLLSNEPLQRWFMGRRLPCVVTGSVYPGITLPSIDEDYRAACRHAAGRLIALGHRHIAFLSRQSRAAGDLESEAGFREGLHPNVRAKVVYHDDQSSTTVSLVKKLFSEPDPPTGMLVANSFCFVSVMTALAALRIRVPDDVSLISRDDDPFLAYVTPKPDLYRHDPVQFAHKLMLILRPMLLGEPVRPGPHRLVPKFVEGGSCRVT